MDLRIDAALLSHVLSEFPEFILIVDRDRTIRYINRVEPGYDRDDVVGMSSTEVLFPESRDILNAAMDRVFDEAQASSYEVQAALPDGSRAWYEARLTPIFDGGHVVGAVIRAANITELKTVSEELAQVKQLLPMCAWCSRIQNEEGAWEGIGAYLKRVGDTDVSHGAVPRM